MTEHAPLPWKLSPTDDTVIVDATGREVCAIDGDYNSPDDWPIMEANAANIVHCVNTNPEKEARIRELEAALSKIVDLVADTDPDSEADKQIVYFAIQQGKAALSSSPPAPANGESEGRDFPSILHRQKKFSTQAFGPGYAASRVIDHIRKEITEVERAPHDIAMLAFDGAWRAGYSAEKVTAAYVTKLEKMSAANGRTGGQPIQTRPSSIFVPSARKDRAMKHDPRVELLVA